MNFLRRIKKAFTLIELVVVIAVIAILATISVVSYLSITNNAKKSNDQQLVDFVNTSLAAHELMPDEGTPKYMDEAMDQVYTDGFSVEKLKDSAFNNYEFIYNSKINRFGILENGKDLVYPKGIDEKDTWSDIWRFASKNSDIDFSIYDFSYYTLDGCKGDLGEVHGGIDAGKNTKLTSISYKNTAREQDVVIRTNGGKLTINDASTGSIKHYGEAIFLDVIQCATASYHEFGFIPQAQIAKGRVVNEVYVEDEKGIQDLFLIAADANSFNEIVVGAAQGAKLPDLDRTDVSIPAGGVLVVEIQTGVTENSTATDEFIYLTKAGVIEQVVVENKGNSSYETAKAKDVSSSVTGVEGKQQTTKTASEQITNVYSKNVAGTAYVDNVGNDITLDELTTKGVVEEAKATLADLEKSQGDNALFAGGAGTKNNPYLISNENQFANIINGSEGKIAYYKLSSDISIETPSLYTFKDLYAAYPSYAGKWYSCYVVENFKYINLDGDSYKINLPTADKFSLSVLKSNDTLPSTAGSLDFSLGFEYNMYFTIENVEFVYSCTSALFPEIWYEVNFKNVITSGSVEFSNNTGLYTVESYAGSITFDNCINNANIIAEGTDAAYNGLLLGRARGSQKVIINNFVNNGKFIGGESAIVFGSANYLNREKYINATLESNVMDIEVNNFVNNGEIRSTFMSNYTPNMIAAAGLYSGTWKITINNEVRCNQVISNNISAELAKYGFTTNFIHGPNDSQLSITANSDKTLSITESSNSLVNKYVVTLSIYLAPAGNENGGMYKSYSEEIDSSLITTFHNYRFTDGRDGLTSDTGVVENGLKVVRNSSGELFYLMEMDNQTISGVYQAPSIVISAYNGDTLISSAVLGQ